MSHVLVLCRYHRSMEGASEPVKVLDRHASLAHSQVSNYYVNPDDKWMFLVGFNAQQGRVVGTILLNFLASFYSKLMLIMIRLMYINWMVFNRLSFAVSTAIACC